MNLTLIYSGGTIGSAGEPLTPLSASAFRAMWDGHVAPLLPADYDFDWQWLEPPIDSCEMTPADWAHLARLILDARGQDAVLLLHGTDTMAWTASALAYLLTLYDPSGQPVARFGRPVVMTGSQRPLFAGDEIARGTDALDNLRTALNACAAGRREVSLAFGGLILRAVRTMKMSTVDDRAFGYPNRTAPCPVLPEAEASALTAQLDRLAPHLGRRAVMVLAPTPGDSAFLAAQVDAVTEALGDRLGAFCLRGFGIGNFPGRTLLASRLRAAHDAGVMLVAASQVPHGPVDPVTYAAGHWLGECGAVATADMTQAAAEAKVQVALAMANANGRDLAAAERFFLTPVAGETRD